LRRDEQGREAFMRTCPPDHPDAESARTRYRTLAAGDGAALLELKPETGRMHQLRVHLASIGRPIAGDARYGGVLMLAGQPVPRLMLHAAALAFPHPNGERMSLTAAAPADFQALADSLRSHAGAA
jgi:tRNA pseudouridine32 synthase/23S rRNA pseudouridine746 synthase